TPEIERVCRRWVGDPERARELAQDVMMVATRRLAEFRGDSSLRTWLHGITRFTCLRALEKKRDLLADDGLIEAADDATGTLTGLERKQRIALVREVAAEVLDDVEQEAVELRYVHGVGQADVGRILGQSGRVLLQRCRRKLERGLRQRAESLGHGSSLFRDR
ncbi:MAG: sigma-70 family RNA polymerase sigma factor, partial [Myxococcota bacterium]